MSFFLFFLCSCNYTFQTKTHIKLGMEQCRAPELPNTHNHGPTTCLTTLLQILWSYIADPVHVTTMSIRLCKVFCKHAENSFSNPSWSSLIFSNCTIRGMTNEEQKKMGVQTKTCSLLLACQILFFVVEVPASKIWTRFVLAEWLLMNRPQILHKLTRKEVGG